MSAAGVALAQSAPQSGVTESTDPAKIAEIERHAQELASRQSTTTATTAEQQVATKQPGARHTKKSKAKSKRTMKDKAPPDQPATTEAK
ncbi:MAG: hypothetical protein V4693_13090 [Pseudomonadota bacterium]